MAIQLPFITKLPEFKLVKDTHIIDVYNNWHHAPINTIYFYEVFVHALLKIGKKQNFITLHHFEGGDLLITREELNKLKEQNTIEIKGAN